MRPSALHSERPSPINCAGSVVAKRYPPYAFVVVRFRMPVHFGWVVAVEFLCAEWDRFRFASSPSPAKLQLTSESRRHGDELLVEDIAAVVAAGIPMRTESPPIFLCIASGESCSPNGGFRGTVSL